MVEKIQISFDDENRIRVLEADKFTLTDQLKNDSMDFLKSNYKKIKEIISFEEIISQLTTILDQQTIKIEQEKLISLGERNKVESESENRKKKIGEINMMLIEKKIEQERQQNKYKRIQQENESLFKIEQEQKLLIEKLSNNEI